VDGSDSDNSDAGSRERLGRSPHKHASPSRTNAGGTAAARRLPWVRPIRGHCLVPDQGSLTPNEEPTAVLSLTDGGGLEVHDLVSSTSGEHGSHGTDEPPSGKARSGDVPAAASAAQPRPLQGAFARQPAVTAARLRIIPTGRVPLQGLQVWGQVWEVGQIPQTIS
jgi:hypothetical protein